MSRAHRSRSLLTLAILPAAGLLTLAAPAGASLVAFDQATDVVYDNGWQSGDNGGSGFGAWSLNDSGGAGGFFIGSSTNNGGGGTGHIDVAGESWGAYGGGAGVTATRPLTGALSVGQGIDVDFDQGFVDGGPLAGFRFLATDGSTRFQYNFLGGTNNYEVRGAANQPTAHGYTPDGMKTSFSLTGTDAFEFKVTYNTGAPVTETFTGALGGTAGTGIDRIELFNAHNHGGSDYDAFINAIAVVPEPATIGLAALAAAMLGARRARRNGRP